MNIKQEFRDFLNESLNESQNVNLNEKLIRMSDNDVDKFIKDNWKSVITYEYNMVAAIQLSNFTNVLYTKDNEYMYISSDADKNKVKEIVRKHNLVEV